ncbi:MAG TPA: efflux RND transporter periplasmic adaptor subunit [Longimicrobiaceae bacterium]|nr:efflux RND transporter periplasmic adaptor subunit [Longimicrobiaceae bacterium]
MRIPRFLRSRRFLGFAAAAVVLLLLASGIYTRIRGEGAEDESGGFSSEGAGVVSATSTFATNIAIPVRGAAAVRDTLVLGVSASGEAAAWKQTVVTALVGGRIASVPVRENQQVGEGRVLVTIDPAQYQLDVKEAEAAVRNAQAAYQELTLFDDEIEDEAIRTARHEAARAKSGLGGAEVRLQRAQLNLLRTRLGSPFSGRAASVQVVPGEWVVPGDELMTVVDLDPIKVEVQVLESEIGYLATGRDAHVTFAAYPGETFTGEIATINPLVESGTRTAKVTVLVPNPGGRVLPGMYARVSLDARRFADRVLVPRSAILERSSDRRKMLFVYEGDDQGGLAKWRYVTTGLANDSLIEILPNTETDSVIPGEIVLIDGHYTLIHDARVRLVEDVADEGGRPS